MWCGCCFSCWSTGFDAVRRATDRTKGERLAAAARRTARRRAPRRGCFGGAARCAASFLGQASGDEPELVPDHQQEKERKRERHSNRERLHRARRLSLVADEKHQCRPEREQDQQIGRASCRERVEVAEVAVY